MRVSFTSTTNFQLDAIRKRNSELREIQEQVASGKKITRISDNPQIAKDTIRIREAQNQNEIFIRNIDNINNSLTNTEFALREISSVINEAKTSVIFSINPASFSNANDRQIVANEINENIERLAGLANTQKDGRPLFSGTIAADPFQYTRDINGKITIANYVGNSELQQISIDENTQVAQNIPGDELVRVFETLIAARDVLENTGGLTEQQQLDELSNNRLQELETVLNENLNRVSQVGSTLLRIEQTRERHSDNKLQLQTQRSQVEDLDIAEGAVELSQRDTALRSTFFVVGQNGSSLLDFIS